jgi:cytochrome c-type biogenesis protein CcmE
MIFGKMKPQRKRRLYVVLFLVATSSVAVGLTLMALNENINLFYSPQQILNGEAPIGKTIRAGGMVVPGSIARDEESLLVEFDISDLVNAPLTVAYTGILPDLFREGQGVVALGKLDEKGVFVAEEVLAKHDENYMPPEVESALADAHASKE